MSQNTRATIAIFLALTAAACSTTPTPKEIPPKKSPQQVESHKPITAKNASYVFCNGSIKSVDRIINPIIESMISQKIPYTQNPANEWRDCSGNFLRLSSYVASTCPDQKQTLAAPPGVKAYKKGGNNIAPGGEKARSSRKIAEWYQSQGRFTPIFYDGVDRPSQAPKDLKEQRNSIKPGTVLWFSLARPKSSDGLSGLFTKNANRGPHINHMAVVTSIKKDEQGNVTRFEMFHGRSTGKTASITKSHFWKWPDGYLANGTKEYPSFGYWNQYLVGIGTLLPAASSHAAR